MCSYVLSLVRPGRLGPALVDATRDAAWREMQVELISDGKSNLTFTLSGPAGELVLRRPPTGKLLSSAHDMGREARVQRGLAATDVPVAPIVLVDEGDLIGVACYVMEKVPGHVIRGALPPGFAASPIEREQMASGFVDTLAALHAVDPLILHSPSSRPSRCSEPSTRMPWGSATMAARRASWSGRSAAAVRRLIESGAPVTHATPTTNPLYRFRLNDTVVVITGASSGLGAGFARAISTVGATLVLATRGN